MIIVYTIDIQWEFKFVRHHTQYYGHIVSISLEFIGWTQVSFQH